MSIKTTSCVAVSVVIVGIVALTGCPPSVTVPNLYGLNLTGAENALLLAGLDKGTVTEEYHSTVPSGRVFSQTPPAGASRPPHTAVSFVISKGPENLSFRDSIRLLTYNVRMIPETWDDFCCDISNEKRAEYIGDLIRADDYDIVVLNEVFDEDSKDAFEDRLSGVFPYYVRKIDMAGYIEDSGLMLFSRFPFEPLPNSQWPLEFPPFMATPLIEAYSDGQIAWDRVAALIYPDSSCSDFDCQSSKGVGYVRVRNPETGHTMNILFSHTQASYGDGDCKAEVDGRADQFAIAQKLIEVMLGANVTAQPVFFMGDLNVDGDQQDWGHGTNFGYLHDEPCESNNLWEWTTLFDTPGTFFTDTMEDPWVHEMQGPDFYNNPVRFDWGLTAGLPVPGERLDYVLWNRAERHQIQHLTREHHLRMHGGYVMSDHLPVCADYNIESTNCCPMDARVPVLDAANNGNIRYPGSMQWFRIDEPGTYLVTTIGDDMAFSVYESKDLTTPAPDYYDETGEIQIQEKPEQWVTAPKFSLPEAPFYIRAYKTDRRKTGTYQLWVHRMSGESKEEAISLLPGAEWLEYQWPAVPLNPEDSVWFKLRIETADNPVPQKTAFRLARYWENNVSLILMDENENVIDKDTEAEPYGPNPSAWSLAIDRDDLGTKHEVLYLKAQRSYFWAITFLIGWDTNLTTLHGMYAGTELIPGAVQEILYCHEETDGGIDDLDETYITIVADGKTRVDDQWTMPFDDDYPYNLEPVLGTIRFVGTVDITLREDDDGGYGEDDHFYYHVGPLTAWTREQFGITHTTVDEDDVGEYSVCFNLSRTLQQPQ